MALEQTNSPHPAVKRRRGIITPEQLATVYDRQLFRQLKRCLRKKDDADPVFLATVERRLKALGQTKEPEKAPEDDPKANDIQGAITEALAGRARNTTPVAPPVEG